MFGSLNYLLKNNKYTKCLESLNYLLKNNKYTKCLEA